MANVSGTLTESVAQDQWLARVYEHDSGVFIAEQSFTTTYNVDTSGFTGAVNVVILPDQGSEWASTTATTIGDRVYPNADLPSYNTYFECTTAGTTGGTEPTWPGSGTVGDGTVTWTWKGSLTRPVVHGPLKPS